jgi:hypothetical protein
MEKRAFDRIPANLELHCFNTHYFGTVTDISEKGMFIRSQKINFPLDVQFEISIPLKEDMLNVHVKVNRVTKSNGYYDGIGVELMKRPYNYLKLIRRLKLTLRNRKRLHYSAV